MKNKEFPPLILAKNLDFTKDEARECFFKYMSVNPGKDALERAFTDSHFTVNYAGATWKENKQVYSFTKEFVEVLMTSPLNVPWDIEIFKKLPYPCFVIKIDDSYALIHYSPQGDIIAQGYIGIFIFVKDAKGRENYGITGMTFPFDKSGIAHDTMEQALTQFTHTMRKEDFPRIRETFQICLYLSAKNAIIHENPVQQKIYRKPFDKPKDKYSEVRIWDCGIRYTKDTVKAIKSDIKYESKSKKRLRPHWKRSHWQHYHVGKGRTEVELKWKEPYFVGKGDTPAVIHVEDNV